MLEYRFDTQLLIEGTDLSEDAIHDYITQNIAGDCLLAGGMKIIKTIFTPTRRGRCWNTRPPWGISTTWWWRTWNDRKGPAGINLREKCRAVEIKQYLC